MKRSLPLVLCTMAALATGGCSAGDPVLRGFGLVPDPERREPKGPAFVEESRRPGGDYMPVGVQAPARAVRARTEAQRKDLEAELEGARSRNEATGRAAVGAGRRVGVGLTAPVRTPPGGG